MVPAPGAPSVCMPKRTQQPEEVLGPKVAGLFRGLCGALSKCFPASGHTSEKGFFGGSVPTESTTMKEGKRFCVGPLENPEIKARIGGGLLSEKDKLSVAGSLFLARKLLQPPPDPTQWRRHADLMSVPAPAASPEYLSFVKQELEKLFPSGWDRMYRSNVASYTPKGTALRGSSRREGGAQAHFALQGSDWFQDQCLAGTPINGPFRVNYCNVKTAGKIRGVTVMDAEGHLLSPLHTTMYDHLSSMPWLLRGEARAARFASFKRKANEVFVSGDYESATDNLSTEVAELILETVLRRSTRVPPNIQALAMKSLRAEINYLVGGQVVRVVQQRRGQLMGNYLSFPLLCLQNYLAFRFLIPRDVPVKINGDDIVFRATRQESDKWMQGVGALGLTLSVGKTAISSKWFSLNSCFFVARAEKDRRGVKEVKVIRMKPVMETPPTGGDFMRFCRHWKGAARRHVGALWLRCHKEAIMATGRSVVAGLGIPADNSQLHEAGLKEYESCFRGTTPLSAVKEPALPRMSERGLAVPVDYALTRDWVKVSGVAIGDAVDEQQIARWESEYRSACYKTAWTPLLASDLPPGITSTSLWWRDVKRTGLHGVWRAARRNVRRWGRGFCLPLRQVPLWSERQLTFWVPRDQLPQRTPLPPRKLTSGTLYAAPTSLGNSIDDRGLTREVRSGKVCPSLLRVA